MIFLADDYIDKYCNTISYLIGRSITENYSFDYIEKSIAYSAVISELEKSNITTIAYTSLERIYSDIFPFNENKYLLDIYGIYGWVGFAYIHLFLKLQITFEALFTLIPIKEMLKLYKLYHEMDINRLVDYIKEKMEYPILDILMKNKNISCNKLSKETSIPLSTIKALRYGIRDIGKMESSKLLVIARELNVKMETLLGNIYLKME